MILFTILGIIVAIYLVGVIGFWVYFQDTDQPFRNALKWPIRLLWMLFGTIQ